MTRINADIPPTKLHRLHLLAELREITMVPASLRRSLRTQTPAQIFRKIPSQFQLNKSHVTFFYDKMIFLMNRFEKLCCEMERRGYTPDRTRSTAFDGFDQIWYNNWTASDADNSIVEDRINTRIQQKP